MEKPKVVAAEEWQQARDELLKAEKELRPAGGLGGLPARLAAAPHLRLTAPPG